VAKGFVVLVVVFPQYDADGCLILLFAGFLFFSDFGVGSFKVGDGLARGESMMGSRGASFSGFGVRMAGEALDRT